ncbi:RNA-directed DNA polymerase from mobile element jockey-like protein [Turdus rufiventris]|nr:RNA-directed DNA polymerase from mobile element jockey-like protein [Turdus rufiventris]
MPSLCRWEMGEEVVKEQLCHLDIHECMGRDVIQPRVQKELVEVLAKTLSIIYHQSWLTGKVPDDWRLATVMPTYKKVWKVYPGNYKGVSLTLVPKKIMEEIIMSAITWHIQDNQGSRPSQHGFRKGRSYLTNLISFYDHVIHLVDEGKTVDVVYLDFTKAFDTVSDRILLKKLKLIAWTVSWVTQNHRITESLGWKRPSRSLSQTVRNNTHCFKFQRFIKP